MLDGPFSLPPGLGLVQGGYCQPAGCDQKFMANSSKARLAAAHQLAGSQKGCKHSLSSQAAVAREGDWPCQSQGLLCLLWTRAGVPPPGIHRLGGDVGKESIRMGLARGLFVGCKGHLKVI